MSKLSDEDKVGLSPQEIEALEDDDTPGGINDLPNEPTGPDEDDAADAATQAAKDKADADKAAADKAAADKAAADDGADEAAKDGEDASDTSDSADDKLFAPTYRADQVEDYDKKMDALTESFEKGDIPLAQYNKDMALLVRAQTKAEIAEETTQQNAAQRWNWEIDRFMDDAKEQKELGQVDYRTNKILQASLDAAVKEIASVPENANRSGRWYLMEAHKQVMANFGRGAAAEKTTEEIAADKAAQKAAADAAANKGRRPDLRTVPKTLGGLPAAGPSDTGGDTEFSHLDKLEGIALERALAKLTPEQSERYAQYG